MKAILIPEPPRYQLTTVPDPVCAADGVIVRTAWCGICGTDLEILRGTMPAGFTRYPVVPGHEWTGVVEEVGRDVHGIARGDRVSVEGYLPCMQCPRCRAGQYNLCPSHEQIGMTQNGGFAEFTAAPARSCHLVAEHIGLDEALMVEPASTVVRGIERVRLRNPYSAAVIGCGPIGLIAGRVLKMCQFSNLLGIDIAPSQSSLALQAGFNQFTGSQDPAELRERSGSDGWDVVVVCAAGAPVFDLATRIVRTGGSIVVIGGGGDSHRLEISTNLFVNRDLEIEGILGYTTESWERTLELLASGRLPLADLITHRLTLDQFDRALGLLESRAEPVGKVAVSLSPERSAPSA